MTQFLTWVFCISWLAMLFTLIGLARYKGKVKVRVHVAELLEDRGVAHYFINVTNLTNDLIVITHTTIGAVSVLNPSRPMPRSLQPGESWETWVSKKYADRRSGSIYLLNKAVVHLSNGKVIRSKRRRNVPKEGFIPGA